MAQLRRPNLRGQTVCAMVGTIRTRGPRAHFRIIGTPVALQPGCCFGAPFVGAAPWRVIARDFSWGVAWSRFHRVIRRLICGATRGSLRREKFGRPSNRTRTRAVRATVRLFDRAFVHFVSGSAREFRMLRCLRRMAAPLEQFSARRFNFALTALDAAGSE